MDKYQKLVESITKCYTISVQEKNLDVICKDMLSEILKLTHSAFGFIGKLVDDDNTKALCLYAYSEIFLPEEVKKNYSNMLKDNGVVFIYKNNLISLVYTSEKVVISNDLSKDIRRGGKCKLPPNHPPINCFLGIPLKFKSQTIGVLGIANKDGGYSQELVDYISPFVSTCANIIVSMQQEAEIKEEANKQIQLAEELGKLKDNFLANMSHEIRTPLNGIIGMTSILERSELTNSQQKYLKIVKTCGFQLLDIINDILDYSKLIAGKMMIDVCKMNIRKCIEESIDSISLRAEEKNLKLTCNISYDVPKYIQCDYKKLRQVLINLLSNSIKFTEKGDVKLRIKVKNIVEDKIILKFEVEDTGVGIQSDKLDLIFNMFEQIDNSLTKTCEGTGLGLAISKSIVNMMGGSFNVDSVHGKGSTFSFTIKVPYTKIQMPKNIKNNILIDKNVLVVDDDVNNRIIYFDLLTSWGIKVQMCSSGVEALIYLKNYKFNVILLDICMPKMNGIELAEIINKDYKNIPIIAVSSIENLCNADDGIFYDKLTKPVKESVLFETLSQLYIDKTNIEKTKNKLPNLNVLIAEDNVINQVVLTKILNQIGINKLEIVGNGMLAIDKIKSNTYDLLLLDIKMPIMDGYTTMLELLKLNINLPKVIALTANALEGERNKCINVYKMDGYVPKPIVIEHLFDEINNII